MPFKITMKLNNVHQRKKRNRRSPALAQK